METNDNSEGITIVRTSSYHESISRAPEEFKIDIDGLAAETDVDKVNETVPSPFEGAISPASKKSVIEYRLPQLTETSAISFHNISYTLKIKKEEKKILQNMSGIFGSQNRGEMIAIMGQSGAGKTTLLNLLAQRVGGKVSGEVLVNGKPATKQVMKKSVGYVHQHDHLYAELTTFETIDMIARLTLRMNEEERKQHISKLLDGLGLRKVAHRIVGTTDGGPGQASRGLSGGERKRLSIAKALIPDPGILLLDEYTSGLDSESAFSCTELLRSVADSGRTVVATIHQPSSDIFFQFDKLCLLAEGRIVYYGPVNRVVEYFNSLGPEYVCPAFFNPAEHVMKMSFISSLEVGSDKPEVLEKKFQASELYQEQQQILTDLPVEFEKRRHASVRQTVKLVERAPYSTQLAVLFARAWKINSRNKLISRVKMFVSVFLGAFIGFFYYQIGYAQTSVSDRLFLLVFTSIIQGVRLTVESISFFAEEKDVILPELENGYYDIGPYFLTKTIVDLPFMSLATILYTLIMLPVSGLQYQNEHLPIFFAVLLLLQLNAQSIGLFFATWLKNLKILTIIVPLLILPTMLLNGVTILHPPRALRWIEYIMYTRYALLIMMRNEFEGLEFECIYPNCPVPTQIAGSSYLHTYDMYFVSVPAAFGILVAMLIFFRFGAFAFLKRTLSERHS